MLSPAELTLLRHACVLEDAGAAAELWQWHELPAGPTLRLRRTTDARY